MPRSTESNTMRNVMIGGFAVSLLVLLASSAAEANKRQEANTQIPALQQAITETLTGSSTVCLDNYQKSIFNWLSPELFPSFQDKFTQNVKNSENNLLSPDSKTRENAKQLLAWQIVAPNGNQTAYDAFIKRIVDFNPNGSPRNAQKLAFLTNLDNAINLNSSHFANAEKIAEGLCEATFRTLDIMNNPKGADLQNGTLTFKSTKYLPINTFPMFTQGRFGKVQQSKGGDYNSGVNTKTNEWKINVVSH